MENQFTKDVNKTENKGNFLALIPICVFLVVYFGINVFSESFNILSVVVAFLIAVLVACLQNRKVSFDDKLSIMAEGLADKNITTMILIFLTAGVFAGILGRDSAGAVANLLLKFIPARFSVVVIFIVACFVSTAMGTSCGTIVFLSPIAVSVSSATGISLPLFIGTVIGGAMFGDNLSFISDTTIAATSTQNCNMRDKFKENFFIALPAALVTIAILFIIALTQKNVADYTPDKINLWLIIPYVLVLIGGILGVNVFIVLIGGILSAFIVKVCLGTGVFEIFTSMGAGANDMFEVIIVTVLVSILSALMRKDGGFDAILYGIRKIFKGKAGGSLGVATLVSLMDIATANNTVAIVMAGPIAKNISEEYGITNTKTASILDIFGSVIQGILPYGAQMLAAIEASGLTAFNIIPFIFYPYLLAISAIVAMFIPSKKK
ncbi:MAG: Na+/H+ antiporter NhaC family protein [Clostridia bacterium]|nr:Na+/H+ antiporter NhaC family protein [Clostridia bacterium]